jgi:hypothetical protein
MGVALYHSCASDSTGRHQQVGCASYGAWNPRLGTQEDVWGPVMSLPQSERLPGLGLPPPAVHLPVGLGSQKQRRFMPSLFLAGRSAQTLPSAHSSGQEAPLLG